MTIGQTIASYRKKQALTQKELGAELKVSDKTISSWENERTYPDISMIIQLSDTLELSLDELLREDTSMIQEIDTTIKDGHFYQRWKKAILTLLILALAFTAWNVSWFIWKEHRQSKIENYPGLVALISDEMLPDDYYYLTISNPPESEKRTMVFHVAIENYMAVPYLWFDTLIKDFKVLSSLASDSEIRFLSSNEFSYISLGRGITIRFDAELNPISGQNFSEDMTEEEMAAFIEKNRFQLEAMLEAVLPVYKDLYRK